MADAMKLDYRCLALRCPQPAECRRFLTGAAAKNSSVPIAAFDHRRTAESCDGFLPRISVNFHDIATATAREVFATHCTAEE